MSKRARISDPQWLAEQDRLRKIRALQEESDLKELLAFPAAQRYILKLLVRSGVFSGGFEPNGSRLYAKEGVRAFGLEIAREVSKVCPGLIERVFQGPDSQSDEKEVDDDASDQ